MLFYKFYIESAQILFSQSQIIVSYLNYNRFAKWSGFFHGDESFRGDSHINESLARVMVVIDRLYFQKVSGFEKIFHRSASTCQPMLEWSIRRKTWISKLRCWAELVSNAILIDNDYYYNITCTKKQPVPERKIRFDCQKLSEKMFQICTKYRLTEINRQPANEDVSRFHFAHAWGQNMLSVAASMHLEKNEVFEAEKTQFIH